MSILDKHPLGFSMIIFIFRHHLHLIFSIETNLLNHLLITIKNDSYLIDLQVQ